MFQSPTSLPRAEISISSPAHRLEGNHSSSTRSTWRLHWRRRRRGRRWRTCRRTRCWRSSPSSRRPKPPLACTCRRLAAAVSSPALPLALALRLGLPPPRPLLPYPAAARLLIRSLHRLRRLHGLWRRFPSSRSATPCSPSLAAFEWAPRATLAASLLAPSSAHGFAVSKSPFVTLSIAESGDTAAALGDMPVCVNFVGENHIVVEPAAALGEDEEEGTEGSSPPEEMYMHFANQRSPGAGRRRRERLGRRGGRMESEHFVRITDAEPTKVRPLQGLWKGICENRTLEFYLVTYDDIGGVTCRRVSETRGQNSGSFGLRILHFLNHHSLNRSWIIIVAVNISEVWLPMQGRRTRQYIGYCASIPVVTWLILVC